MGDEVFVAMKTYVTMFWVVTASEVTTSISSDHYICICRVNEGKRLVSTYKITWYNPEHHNFND
jgi:hypothetical protein